MSLPITYLSNWPGEGAVAFEGPASVGRVQTLPLYELGQLVLEQHTALLLPANVDQRYLQSQRTRLDAYLQAGGQIVCNGHVAYCFLSCLRAFEAAADMSVAGLGIARGADHPVFAGVDPAALTFRRGVAGFYARGINPPPAGAVVLNTMGPQGLPVDWVFAHPGGGRLLVHAGNDLWMYASGQDSAARILPQLLDWLEEERT